MIQIHVKVKTHSKQNKIIVEDTLLGKTYKIYTSKPPENGKANEAVIEQLAEYFDTAKSNISIARGHTSTTKIIQIKKS